MGHVTAEAKDIKSIIKQYYELFYVHKFDNLNETNQFFERYNMPKLTQKEINNLNKTLSIKEIVLVIELPSTRPKWIYW